MRSQTGPKWLHLGLVLVGPLLLFGHAYGIMAQMESPANGLGLKEQSHIVAQHNRLRSRVTPMAANMQKMEWNEELALLARGRASSCQTNVSRSPSPPLTGWNMHASARNATSFSQVLQRWFEEGLHYDLQRGRCQENAHCQHYTQMVWATSHHVGCARQVCGREREQSWDFYVCSYSPGGNWRVNGRSLAPYRAGVSCSLCTSSRSGCVRHWDHEGGLCEVPQNPCRMSCGLNGRLNVSSCRCGCDPGFTGLFCQVRCSVRCEHGRYRDEECSCRCDLGYGGPRCADKLQFPVRGCSVRIDGDCFVVSPEADTYYAAKARCQERGGMLAQVHNQKVQDILAFYLGRLEATNHLTNLDFQTRNFWIGLTYKSLKDSFRWDTGEPLVFSSFAFGQPDNQGFGNCVEMQVSTGFNWNDQRCKTRNRYICQHAPHHIALWNVGG